MGSKARIAKDILPIILKDRKPGQWYVETMVGGANLIDKVECPRLAADINPYVIEALKLIRDKPESLPDSITELDYQELKDKKELNGLTGVVGFGCSFGGKWFGGYARSDTGRNYMLETKKNALNQSPLLKGIMFLPLPYNCVDIPENSIIYCDPPYAGTTKYKDGFYHTAFWEWVRIKSLEGHSVFVSEYKAPEDFICVWEKELTTSFSTSDNIKATEKLFIYNDLY